MSTAEDSRTAIDRNEANRHLAEISAVERIRWGVAQFGDGAVLLSSMQKTSSILMHMMAEMNLTNEILFVDTGYHFHETLLIRDEFMRRYRLNIVTLYPKHTPEAQEHLYGRKLFLFKDGQPQCCELRKEQPFIGHMRQQGHRLVMNGLRKSEGGKRGSINFLDHDPRYDGYKLNPILDWSDEEVETYLTENDVLVHPLHAQSYPSIGCACCTTPVAPGEDARAGRWRHLRSDDGDGPQYCGINFTDGSGI